MDREQSLTLCSLRLGPLGADGCKIFRSGLRWLIHPGQYCRANQVFAYCNVSLNASGMRMSGPPPFAEERDLQVAFASRVAGRVFAGPGAGRDGFLSIRSVDVWDADAIVAHIEADTGAVLDGGRLRLLMLAGRRMTDLG